MTPDGTPIEPVLALDARYYTDPALYSLELDRIFCRTWQYACHTSELQAAGDFVTFSVGDQGLFAIRDKNGTLRAFYNVCQHRAHELLGGAGNARRIVCPYHSWTYTLDGNLAGAPNSQNVPGFDKSGICLTEVRLELFCGFVFVNLDADAAPMAAWYPEAEAGLRGILPGIDDMVLVQTEEASEDCNWKVTVENYNECYHCRNAHPTFATGVVDPDSYNILPEGYSLHHTTRSADLSKMTYAIDLDSNPRAGDYGSWFLWPALSFQVYPGGALNSYVWRPEGVTRTRVQRGWFTGGAIDWQIATQLARQDLDTTVAEDIRIVNSVQRGLASRGYRPGPLVLDPRTGVNSEHSIEALKRWTLEAHAG